MADAARSRQARIDVRPVHLLRNPFRDTGDVVLVDSLVAAAVAPWTPGRRRRRRPLAAIAHQQPGGVGHGALRTAVQRRLDLFVYRRCDLVIAASAALAEELVRCGLADARIHVAQPGRDLPIASKAVADMRHGRRIAVLCVGSWLPSKGIIELLDAVSVLPAGAATLHLVGATDVDGRYRARVIDRLAAPDVVDRVIVHGALAPRDLAGLYVGADVFALPSYIEAFGTVYAEALTAGLPVVGWRSGNLPNLIDDQIEGCLVAPGDVAGLSRTLQRLAIDDRWRSTLAAAARARGETLPTWGDTAAAFFGALSRLATAPG